jgi:hypothetical protein
MLVSLGMRKVARSVSNNSRRQSEKKATLRRHYFVEVLEDRCMLSGLWLYGQFRGLNV